MLLEELLFLRKAARKELKKHAARHREIQSEIKAMGCTLEHCDVCEKPMTTSVEAVLLSCGHRVHRACFANQACGKCGRLTATPFVPAVSAQQHDALVGLERDAAEASMMAAVLELRQLKLKVMSNTAYGVFGTEAVMLRDVRLASLITAQCRSMNLHCNHVLGGETWRGWQTCMRRMHQFYTVDFERYKHEACFDAARQSYLHCLASSGFSDLDSVFSAYPHDEMDTECTDYGDTDSIIQSLSVEYMAPFLEHCDRVPYALALGVCQVTLLKEDSRFVGSTMALEVEGIAVQFTTFGKTRKRYVLEVIPDKVLGNFKAS